jgi:endonuclease/exonuclease/phosphatase family metal-dependent hydrolase
VTNLATDELRILHWNVHSWRDADGRSNLNGVIDLIDQTTPHIVSLVEVDEPWGTTRSLDHIAHRCGYRSLFVPTFEYGDQAPTGGFGNALLTRVPVLGVRLWHLNWPPSSYDGTEPSEPRSVTLAQVGHFEQPVWIGATHLQRNDSHARSDSIRRLSALVHTLDDPWILCGDFNTPPTSWPRTGDANAFTIQPDPPQPTYPIDAPTEPIDYCVASSRIDLTARVLAVKGSDHLPVLYSMRLPAAS